MTTIGGMEHGGGEDKGMIRAVKVLGPGWAGKAADTVVLGFDDRHRRRLAMEGTRGLAFLLDLEQVVALRGGDALVLEDGRLVEVVAAPEPLIEIRGSDPQHLVRIAWHLGNRHLPTQITPRGLRIRRDHVIADMVRGLGGRVVEIEAPFDPEGGAYTSPVTVPAPERSHHHAHHHGHHGHDHDPHDRHRHDHGHAHDDHHHHEHGGHAHHGHADHGHDHDRDHDHDHDHDHCHDGTCGHDHDHGR